MRLWYRLCRAAISAFYHVIWWPRVEGREYVPRGPCLICSNHRSWFDPPLIGVALGAREIGYLAKEELFGNPLARALFWSWNIRPIRRGTVDRAAVEHIDRLLARGIPVLAFPEGTRSRTGRMLPPRPGIGRLVRTTGVPVVPAYVVKTSGMHQAPFRWGRVCVRFGTPISAGEVSGFSDDKAGYRALSRLIMERICLLSDDPDRDRRDALESSETPV